MFVDLLTTGQITAQLGAGSEGRRLFLPPASLWNGPFLGPKGANGTDGVTTVPSIISTDVLGNFRVSITLSLFISSRNADSKAKNHSIRIKMSG